MNFSLIATRNEWTVSVSRTALGDRIFLPELFPRASLEKLHEKCCLNSATAILFVPPLLLLKLISRFIWLRVCVCVFERFIVSDYFNFVDLFLYLLAY